MELRFRMFSSLPSRAATCCCSNHSLLSALLDREWMLPDPGTKIHKISLSEQPHQLNRSNIFPFTFSNDHMPALGASMMMESRGEGSSFYVVRDDLLHPLVNGNKARKLDALLPIIQQYSATDVVTCGGCQSAHAAAVAVACAERGIRAHLLLRGEQPEVSTGYNLISLMYGNTRYVSRSLYANREVMLYKHANMIAGSNGLVISVDGILDKCSDGWKPERENSVPSNGNTVCQTEVENNSRKVVIINEGASNAVGLLGAIRLVSYLSQSHIFGMGQPVMLVLDAGTGTTAVGLALGALWLGQPWKITAVMLADTIERYKMRESSLISNFKQLFKEETPEKILSEPDSGFVHWVERTHPRRFGKVLDGEIEFCRQIAQETGILLDPVYTLAGWERAMLLSHSVIREDAKVVMLHTGGTMGLFGLAQRYVPYFKPQN